MVTIEEYKNVMTVYFSKRTGAIHSILNGEQTIEAFGPNAEDMAIIYDLEILPRNEDVKKNPANYKMDLESRHLIKILTTEEEERIAKLEEENKALKQSIEELKEIVNNLTGSKEVQDNV